MDEQGFRNWCAGKIANSTIDDYCFRIGKAESAYGDIDTAYANDLCASVLARLRGAGLRNSVSAVNEYVQYKNAQRGTTTSISHARSRTSGIKWSNLQSNVPACLGSAQHPDQNCGNIIYAENVAEDERIPGLAGFLHNELEPIVAFFRDLVNERIIVIEERDRSRLLELIGDAFELPIILRKETPSETYCFPWSDSSKTAAIERIATDSTISPADKLARIREILDDNSLQTLTMRIPGRYVHSGNKFYEGRHIEIFFRNFDCPDEEQYKAAVAQTLAHELFHYWHHLFIGQQYLGNAPGRKPVIESTADFFSVLYSLDRWKKTNNRERHYCAEKRFKEWRRYYGTTWPYAYALCFCLPQFGIVRMYDVYYYVKGGDIQKFFDVLRESKKNFASAYEILIEDSVYT